MAEDVTVSSPREQAPVKAVTTVANVPTDSFVYTSETPRYYVARGLTANHGDVAEWPDGAPDPLWDSVN